MSKNTQISELINYISVDGSGNVVLSSGQLVATQSYVSTAITNLVNSAPSTLDTLNELATALGNDPNFATTIATSIGTKQAQLNGTGFVKVTGTTVSYDNSTYLTTSSASSTYLPLVGGTLTGALSGTSATFSGNLTATSGTTGAAIKIGGFTNYGTIQDANDVRRIWFENTGSFRTLFDLPASGTNFSFRHNDGTILLSLASTGAATFSSSVTATIFDSTSNAFRFSGSNALSLVTLGGQSVVKINAAGYWGTQLVGANDQGILVTNTGNTGIGTNDPKNKLHVQSGNVTALFSGNSTLVNEYSGIVVSPYAAQDANGLYGIEIRGTITQSTPNYLNPRMDFLVQNTNTYLPADRGVKMTILGSGYVGVGTSNPSALMHLMAPTGVGSSTQLIFDRAGGYGAYYVNYAYESTYYTNGSTLEFRAGNALTQIRLTSNNAYTAGNIQLLGGNVGIGSNSPQALLHVQAANNVVGTILVKGGKEDVTSVGEINSRLDFGSNDSSVNNDNNIGGRIASVTEYSNGAFTGLAFYTFQQGRSPDLKEVVRISNTGNVGINDNNPGEKLDVNGNTRVQGTTMLGSNVGLLQFGMDGTRFNAYGYSHVHIKTSILKGADTMISFNIRGYMYSPQNLDTDVAFYCYAPVSFVYGVTINHKAYSGFTVGMYYSSDNYVCIYVDSLSTYGGFTLNWINTSLIQHGGRIYAIDWVKTNSTAAAF